MHGTALAMFVCGAGLQRRKKARTIGVLGSNAIREVGMIDKRKDNGIGTIMGKGSGNSAYGLKIYIPSQSRANVQSMARLWLSNRSVGSRLSIFKPATACSR
jgi:hypothetical protein